MQPDELIEKPMSPMQYARSGLGTAEMNGKLIAAGKSRRMSDLSETFNWLSLYKGTFMLACDMQTLEDRVYLVCLLLWHSTLPHSKKTEIKSQYYSIA